MHHAQSRIDVSPDGVCTKIRIGHHLFLTAGRNGAGDILDRDVDIFPGRFRQFFRFAPAKHSGNRRSSDNHHHIHFHSSFPFHFTVFPPEKAFNTFLYEGFCGP